MNVRVIVTTWHYLNAKKVRYVQDIFDTNQIVFVDTSQMSIKEIVANIVNRAGLKRRY